MCSYYEYDPTTVVVVLRTVVPATGTAGQPTVRKIDMPANQMLPFAAVQVLY